jgi:uncharacterized membrane protein (UPF0136 family)
MNWHVWIWSYLVLLLVGGLIGFIKAGSKASLIASVAFAIPLVLTVVLGGSVSMALGFLAAHFVFFAVRFARSKKFMPGGLLSIASAAAAIAVALTSRH